jgi:hypothetical protein
LGNFFQRKLKCARGYILHIHTYTTHKHKKHLHVYTHKPQVHTYKHTHVYTHADIPIRPFKCATVHIFAITHTHTHTPPHTNTHYNTRTHYIDMCTIQILHTTQKTHLHFAPTHTHTQTYTYPHSRTHVHTTFLTCAQYKSCTQHKNTLTRVHTHIHTHVHTLNKHNHRCTHTFPLKEIR